MQRAFCGTDTITYEYDELNQLVRENNSITGETWVYTYDLGGNITSKTKYAYTTATNPSGGTRISYSYDDPNWPDRLTKYNNKDIDSDAIGNIIDDGTWTYTWQNGRQLQKMESDDTIITYTYDSDGMRTSKTVNGTTTKYMYYGGQLIAMDTEFGPVYFHYDSTGVMAMEVQGTMLYYIKNAQGDILAMVDTNGYPVVEYTYDTWGNVISTTGLYATTYGLYNPFRYRGYVYDDETGLYYLSSRYYNPELCRFISTDDTSVLTATPSELTDKNLFAYCDNNPVSRADYGGEFWDTVLDVVSLFSSVAEVIVNPMSGTAWASLAADVVCTVVPGLTGGGAIVKAFTKADDVVDTANAIYKAADKASDIRKATGSYEIIYKSGSTYVGKGGYKRAIKSAQRNAAKYSDEVASISWKSAPNSKTAFINEYQSMCKYGGPNNRAIGNKTSYNKIWSPGRKYYYQTNGSYYNYGGRYW